MLQDSQQSSSLSRESSLAGC